MDKEDAGVLSHSGDEESGRSREKTKGKILCEWGGGWIIMC